MDDKKAPSDRPTKSFDRQRHSWIIRLVKDARLTGTALRVGVILAEKFMNRQEGGVAWPSIATLKAELGAGERSIQDGIKQLVDRGHLLRKNREGKTPLYSMRENDPRENPHPSTPADFRTPPPQISKGVTRTPPPQIRASTPADFRTQTYIRTSLIEPMRSASPHACIREGENLEKDVFGSTSPSPSVKIAAAASSQARQEVKPKVSATASKPRTAGKRAKPIQGDLIAQDAERVVVETLKAVRSIYPVGRRHPHDDAVWQKVGAELRKALRIASASEILDGMARYAASGENFDYIRDPRNWLKDCDWLKPWLPKRGRAAGFSDGPAAPAHYDSSRLEAEYGDAWHKPLGSL